MTTGCSGGSWWRRCRSASSRARSWTCDGGRPLALNEQPDLLLVDGLLPDTTGVDWIKKLRRAGRATPVLFVTSFWKSMRDFELVTNTLGATQLLRNPALPAEIADRVDSLLGIPAPAAAPCDAACPRSNSPWERSEWQLL